MTPAFLTLLMLLLMAATVPGQQAEGLRDMAVYEAVLRHTILPESRRFNAEAHNRTVSRILVADQTYATCDAGVQSIRQRLGCLSDEDQRRFLQRVPRVGGFIFEKLLSEQTRNQLAASLRERNQANHPFVARALDIVDAISPMDLPAGPPTRPLTRDFVLFSRPGYSADGHALVHARYVCGSLCGYVWLFLVEHRDGRWEVADVHTLWIS